MVQVYRVHVIDREEEMILDTRTVMGETESEAMLGFPLTPKMKQLKRQDKLVLLTNNIGSFEKFEIQEVRVRGDGSFGAVDED